MIVSDRARDDLTSRNECVQLMDDREREHEFPPRVHDREITDARGCGHEKQPDDRD